MVAAGKAAVAFLWTPAAADLRNLYQCLVRLARWRAVKEFRMSDPDRLTSRNDTASALDKQGLILRIIVVAFLAALFWHTVVAAALP
jgi:hypothetical protein